MNMQSGYQAGQMHGERMAECTEACQTCHSVCVEMVGHCLERGGKHAEPHHVRLLLDCAEICQTSANFMLRGSDMHAMTCGVCTQVCERCAEDCTKFPDDPMMMQCAEICRTCAASCREMSSGSGMQHHRM